jgi:hypothetical protein
MSEDTSKRRGRPKTTDGVVSLRLPATLHVELYREAMRQRRTMSEVMRDRLSVSQKLTGNVTQPLCNE